MRGLRGSGAGEAGAGAGGAAGHHEAPLPSVFSHLPWTGEAANSPVCVSFHAFSQTRGWHGPGQELHMQTDGTLCLRPAPSGALHAAGEGAVGTSCGSSQNSVLCGVHTARGAARSRPDPHVIRPIFIQRHQTDNALLNRTP